jgi:glycerol-3-phosphate cytidylyltransferase
VDKRQWAGVPASGSDGGGTMVRGYVPGVFDMFHIGHLNILRNARENCDWLIAGVVTDEKAYLAKSKLPVIPLAERVSILQHITLVDEVIVEHQPSKLEVWNDHPFDVIFKGDDWRGTAKGERLERELGAVGVRVCYFPYTMETSSTLLRAALEELAS